MIKDTNDNSLIQSMLCTVIHTALIDLIVMTIFIMGVIPCKQKMFRKVSSIPVIVDACDLWKGVVSRLVDCSNTCLRDDQCVLFTYAENGTCSTYCNVGTEVEAAHGYVSVSDTCQPGFVKYENSCYWFSPKSAVRSWDEGKAYCLNMTSYLVIITSAQEDKFIREYLLQNAANSGYWIGANDQQVEGNFQWMSTGSHKPVNYTNWYPDQPNNGKGEHNCVELRQQHGFRWNDWFCSDRRGFICEQF
ncbi:perlucin-like [Gigantopelta aegis]|uniref:perlucin-like n=1 Tax=Gigantopelta aegis TaxID=1735272 RepID=UPI001B888F3F|nr:perlucin-like [Gigantopelta aegis]